MQIEKTTFKFLKVKTEANCGKENHTEIEMSLDLGFFQEDVLPKLYQMVTAAKKYDLILLHEYCE